MNKNEHVTAWLEAYYDGELSSRQVRQVEEHLETCESCQNELENLRLLSSLLQESHPVTNLIRPEFFVSQVGLRLSRREESSTLEKSLRTGWRLAPVGLLGAWAFVQAVFIVSGLLKFALRVVPGGDLLAGLAQSEHAGFSIANLFTPTNTGLIDFGRTSIDMLQAGGPLGWGVTLNLGLTILIALLYWSWLASWWAIQKNPPQNSKGE